MKFLVRFGNAMIRCADSSSGGMVNLSDIYEAHIADGNFGVGKYPESYIRKEGTQDTIRERGYRVRRSKDGLWADLALGIGYSMTHLTNTTLHGFLWDLYMDITEKHLTGYKTAA